MANNGSNAIDKCISTCVVVLWLLGISVDIIYGYYYDIDLRDVALTASWWTLICVILFALVQILIKPVMKRAYMRGKTSSSVVKY